MLRIVTITALLASGCAGTQAPSSIPAASTLAKLQDQLAALDTRIAVLERAPREPPPQSPPKWSCSARCGHQSTQTTAFRIVFRHVVSEGTSAAQAFKHLVEACDDGRLYDRIDDERFFGGDMKSSCIEGR